MSIPTSRAAAKAEIRISYEKCNGCGSCVSVCKDFNFEIIDKKVALTGKPMFGCIACGHCMAICPNGAIEIFGRTLSPADLFELPPKETVANYEQLTALLARRRSIREFRDKPVEQELIEKIINAAQSAPMGIPPSDVRVLVLDSKEKVRQFSSEYCRLLESMRWFVSPWFLTLLRPFISKTDAEMFRKFIRPLFDAYTGNMNKGLDLVTYDAPLAMYFYGSPYTDPADPLIAATYAMIAGESLGLGSCMLGAVHMFLQYGKKARRFREKHGIKYKSREGLVVIFGHPAVKYKHGLKRTFAAVDRV
jgi:ferredoxin